MERGIVRVLVIVGLVFFLAGDITTILSSVLNLINIAPDALNEKPLGAKGTTSGEKATLTKEDLEDESETLDILGATTISKSTLMSTIRNSCLPKLICELNATPHRESLSESERSLLGLIRDTSISMTAEVTSKYHFAAHMGQLIAGIEGTGCHNFYPGCPFPGLQVIQMMKKVKIR